MEQKYIMDIIDSLNFKDNIKLEDIPEIDLYMDQVIQLFERKYGGSLRNEDEKVLTKTMINNYAKDDLFMPVSNKRYSKDNLILISMIYQMKGALSIKDIKASLETMVKKSIEGHTEELRNFYTCYLELLNSKIDDFKTDIDRDIEHVNTICRELKFNDEYEEKLFMILNLVTMSNAYRRLAEKLIDDLQ